jgi:hypothetical protein
VGADRDHRGVEHGKGSQLGAVGRARVEGARGVTVDEEAGERMPGLSWSFESGLRGFWRSDCNGLRDLGVNGGGGSGGRLVVRGVRSRS